MKRISSGMKHLLALLALSLIAFFGFGSVFEDLGVSFGIEATTAAFGALFIIFSTKFLMEQENESQRKQFVFEQNVNEYRNLADLQMKVLQDGKITLEEVNQLKAKHALLLITGSKGAIETSGKFLDLCVARLAKNSGELTGDEPWGCAVNYFLEARAGLYLPNDDIDVAAQKQKFLKTEKDIQNVARAEVELEQYLASNAVESEAGEKLRKLLQLMEEASLEPKISKKQISIYPNGKKGRRGFVLSYLRAVRQDGFVFNTPDIGSSEELDKLAKLARESGFEAEVKEGTNNRNKGTFALHVDIKFSALEVPSSLDPLYAIFQEIEALRIE